MSAKVYLDFFSLKQAPFALTPDTEFFYKADTYHEALNILMVSIHGGEGFIKITGEVGTGKTMLCRTLLNALADEEIVTAYIPNPDLSPTEFKIALADELNIPRRREVDQHLLLKLVTERLIQMNHENKRFVLLVDEAQAIPDETMETLRLLTNLETEKTKLLQVVIFGQPELDDRLAQNRFRQLMQRVTFSYRLEGLDDESVTGYIRHRLMVAGYSGPDIFAKGAYKRMCMAARGTPRVINILCNKAMMAAYGEGSRFVTASHVSRAIRDTEGVKTYLDRWQKRWAYALVFTMGLGTALLLNRLLS